MLIMRHSTTGTVVLTLLGTNTVGEQRDMPRDRPPQGLTGYHDFPLAGLLGFCRLAKYRRFYFYANGSSLVFPVRKRRNRNHLLSSNRARGRHRPQRDSFQFCIQSLRFDVPARRFFERFSDSDAIRASVG